MINTKSYCQERLEKLSITPDINKIRVTEPESGQRREIAVFVPDHKNDDILIHYVSLQSQRETYLKSKKERPYIVRRKKVVEKVIVQKREIHGYEITCANCGKQAIMKRKSAKFCSRKCRIQKYNEGVRERRRRLNFEG